MREGEEGGGREEAEKVRNREMTDNQHAQLQTISGSVCTHVACAVDAIVYSSFLV